MSHYNFKKVTTVPTAKVKKSKPTLNFLRVKEKYVANSFVYSNLKGVYRRDLVENAAQDTDRRAQTLQDRAHTLVLHAQGEILAAELSRSLDAHSRRVSQTRRGPSLLLRSHEHSLRQESLQARARSNQHGSTSHRQVKNK